MIRVEYALDTMPIPEGIVVALIVVGVVALICGIIAFVRRHVLQRFEGPWITDIIGLIAITAFAILLMGSFSDKYYIEEAEQERVAAELTEKTCREVTPTDVLLMTEGDELSFEYDRVSYGGFEYITMEGSC